LHVLTPRFHIGKSLQHGCLHTELGLSGYAMGNWVWVSDRLDHGHEFGQSLGIHHLLLKLRCCMFCVKHPKEEETNHLGRHGKQ
jgi:hypothetical protein